MKKAPWRHSPGPFSFCGSDLLVDRCLRQAEGAARDTLDPAMAHHVTEAVQHLFGADGLVGRIGDHAEKLRAVEGTRAKDALGITCGQLDHLIDLDRIALVKDLREMLGM